VREIPLTKGYVALVDDEDYESLSRFKWYAEEDDGGKRVYAFRNVRDAVTRKRRTISMHRSILGTPPGMDTDHINKNSLDNRRGNLRVATRPQNASNTRTLKPARASPTSKYRGVSWTDRSPHWVAQIKMNGEHRSIGRFRNERTAAYAYDDAAYATFGEFATLNFARPQMPDFSKMQ
jgi:hypothetical protein